MDWLIVAGSLSLGILVGILVAFYVYEADKWDLKAVRGSVAVFLSSSVIAFFHFLGGPREIWVYPIGLLIGAIFGVAIEYVEEFYMEPRRRGRSRSHNWK